MDKTTPRLTWLLVPALALMLTACATPGDEERVEQEGDQEGLTEEEREATPDEDEDGEDARVWSLEDRDALEGEELQEALDDPDSPISERIVYFAFDSSEIPDEHMDILESHGDFLADHPAQEITIEGHTDERGSREYNLALGERRAEAVKRILVLNGATEDQLEVVSYGEEDPAASGSTEEAYEQNRRAELVYQR